VSSLEEANTSLEEAKTSLEEAKISLVEAKTSLEEAKTFFLELLRCSENLEAIPRSHLACSFVKIERPFYSTGIILVT
jgi:hypothetical protein